MRQGTVRINYDDSPDTVSEKFADTLRLLGVNVAIQPPKTDDEVWIDYKITVPDCDQPHAHPLSSPTHDNW